jgi:hypothetical protein
VEEMSKKKKAFKAIKRYQPDWDGYMEQERGGDYVKFADVAELLKLHFGIDICDPVKFVEPKEQSMIKLEGQTFNTLYKQLLDNANWSKSITEIRYRPNLFLP